MTRNIIAIIFATLVFLRPDAKAADFAPVVENYANIVHASYEDSLIAARELEREILKFTQSPSADGLEKAKEKWIASRQPYLQTEVYRFYGGPIDSAEGPEAMINAWPMDESYIDYVEGAPETGLINDPETYPEITPELIGRLNERAGETAISCGYHAIEFLLWGQDFYDDSPGRRPFTDFTTRKHADRRKEYLNACTALLITHLEYLVSEWAPEKSDNYRAEFLKEDPLLSLWNIIYGAKTLSGKELSGERLLVAWDLQEQEDEHSCFSDTTTQDGEFDALGVRNLIEGKYRRIDGSIIKGPGLKAAAHQLDPDLAEQLVENADGALEKVRAIPSPFDQAILGDDDEPSRKAIMTAVESLEDLSWLLGQLERKVLGERKAPEVPEDG